MQAMWRSHHCSSTWKKNKNTIYDPKYSNSVDSILKNRTIHAIEDKNDYVVTFDCENKCF